MSSATDPKRARASAALELYRADHGDVPALAGHVGSPQLPVPKRARQDLPGLDAVLGGAPELSRAAIGDLPAVDLPRGAPEPPDAERASNDPPAAVTALELSGQQPAIEVETAPFQETHPT